MRFLVMVFLSLFLMTNVSVAKPNYCRDLKVNIQTKYMSEEGFRTRSGEYYSQGNMKGYEFQNKLADAELVRASQYAAIYMALCK